MAARPLGDELDRGVVALGVRYGLAREAQTRLLKFAGWLLSPHAPTSIKTPLAALNDHLADSLVALELDLVRSANRVLDLGSGAGLPGIPLAVARPGGEFALLESAAPKVRFLDRVVDDCRIANVEVVHARAETFAQGERRFDVVTARAVAPLPVVLEYAAPLLRVGGTLVVWRGRRGAAVEASARSAAEELGLGVRSIRPVQPYQGAEHRHLYVVSKLTATPPRFPRRPGMALKRPLVRTASSTRASSDRIQR